MARNSISPAEAEDLRHLYVELERANWQAVAALRTEPPGDVLEGQALARFVAADKEIGEVMKRIRAIIGD